MVDEKPILLRSRKRCGMCLWLNINVNEEPCKSCVVVTDVKRTDPDSFAVVEGLQISYHNFQLRPENDNTKRSAIN